MRTVIFIALALFSCEGKSTLNNASVQSGKETSPVIIGTWGIYVTSYDGELESVCNACPKAVFSEDGTGEVIFPNGTKRSFNWKAIGQRVSIKNFYNRPDDFFFSDGEYSLERTSEKEFTELKMTLVSSAGYHVLRGPL